MRDPELGAPMHQAPPLPVADPYRLLKPLQQRFVDGIVAGYSGTQVMRTLKPRLRRPDSSASKWLRHPHVRTAIEDRTRLGGTSTLKELYQLGLTLSSIESYLERIETRLVKLERALATPTVQADAKSA